MSVLTADADSPRVWKGMLICHVQTLEAPPAGIAGNAVLA